MIRLAVRTLRYRKGGFIAAFLTMFLGAAIVMACVGLLETGVRATVPPQQLAGADVVVAGDQSFDHLEEYDWAVASERVRIDAALVDTVTAVPGVEEANGYVFDHPAPEGTIDAIGVVAESGTSVDQLQELIDAELSDSAITLVGDDRGLAERPEAMSGAEGLTIIAGVVASWALLIAMFGVASMLALSIQQRHRELALLRAVGSTPGQLRKLVLGETVILAAIATGLAILPGRWLSEFLFQQLVDSDVVIGGLMFHMGWIPMVVAITAALLAAVGGAVVAGGRAANTRPTEALAATRMPERRPFALWRLLLGLVLLAGASTLIIVTMTINSGKLASGTGSPAVLLLTIALAVLSPVLIRPLVALLHPLGALTGQSGRLAMLNARAGIDRTAAVAMPIIVLTGIATGLLYMHSTGKNAVHEEFVDSQTADAVITAEDVDAQLVEEVRTLPGVAVASEYARSTGYVEEPFDDPANREGSGRQGGWTLEGTTPDGAGAVLPAPVTEGTVEDLHGDAVALDASNAEELGVGLGDPITVRMGDSTVIEVEVVALYTAGANDETLLLPIDVLTAHTTEGHATEILVTSDGDTSTERVITEIEELVADEDGVTVTDSETLAAEYAEEQDSEAFPIYMLVALIVSYSAISMINALATSTNARRREFGLQRLIGSTHGQVLRMLCIEGLLAAVIGVLLGTISATTTVVAFSIGRADTVYPSGSPVIYPLVVGLTVLLTLLATLVPARRALRHRPVEVAAE
ncbi:ABC transporter permease [Halostreptopolyspora alba]|uniref:FtsX-like permease family protein n=1 Tax=Halostreptopolyspora alba TaxID=2487137 RepID=A0A3N0EEF6_9ACTN|nr:FtsX-like permease family protein [Nocardiopsaceae bacterium YIM 96095]